MFEVKQETDGRLTGEGSELAGVLAYRQSLHVLAERAEYAGDAAIVFSDDR